MDKDTLQALYGLITYICENEATHWEEEGCPENHVYVYAKKLMDWMAKQKAIWELCF